MTNIRMVVYEALLEAAKSNGNAGDIFKDTLSKYAYLDKQQRAFIHCMLEGVTEREITLDYVIDSVSSTPVSKMKKPVKILLRMGVYQLLYMDSVPQSAACNETVNIAKKKHLGNLAGFVNGVLRSIARLDGKVIFPDRRESVVKYLSVVYSTPEVVVETILNDYGEEVCEAILTATQNVSPVYARVNTSRIGTAALLAKLNSYPDVDVTQAYDMDAFVFERMDSLFNIDEFEKGLFTIQDITSQLVCRIAGIREGDTVLDVCASPGGKSMHAADILNGTGRVIACDVSEDKITRIKENIERCAFCNVETMVADATVYNEKLCGTADVLICDAPCSGLGVMGRKNDIRYSVTAEGLASLEKLQRDILDNAVKYLRPGGTFIYSTCTITKAENQMHYDYIKEKLGLKPVSFYDELPDGFKCESAGKGYMQILPAAGKSDGFFISKFRK